MFDLISLQLLPLFSAILLPSSYLPLRAFERYVGDQRDRFVPPLKLHSYAHFVYLQIFFQEADHVHLKGFQFLGRYVVAVVYKDKLEPLLRDVAALFSGEQIF